MTTTSAPSAGEFPLTDEQLSAIAYKGFNDYWTEHCAGRDDDAWAASAKAVITALRAQAAEGEQSAAHAAGQEPDMRAICEALGFDPTNHHNAANCPYCRPTEHPLPVAGEEVQEKAASVALRELVECKDLKSRLEGFEAGSTDELVDLGDEYARRKPLAWAFARKVLASDPGPRILWPDMLEAEAKVGGVLAGAPLAHAAPAGEKGQAS